MFGGDYFSQSIWSKTANAPSAAMAAGRPPNGVEDEFLSISRIGVVTKENLREADLNEAAVALNSRHWNRAFLRCSTRRRRCENAVII